MIKRMTKAEKTASKIEKEEAKLAELNEKKKEIEDEISASMKEISNLKKQLEIDKLEQLMKIMRTKNVSTDELIEAAKNDDFYSIIEKIEKGAKKTDKNETVDYNTEDDSDNMEESDEDDEDTINPPEE